jgi:hypothetical protein
VLFNPDVGLAIPYTNAGVSTQIAPGWYLTITASGAGTVNVTRAAIAGSQNFATNPPYTLTINPNGGATITSLILSQRLQGNPNIFAGGYVNAGLMLGPSSSQVTVYYAPQSIPFVTPIAVLGNIAVVTAYVNATIPVALPAGANGSTPANGGYVDIQYSLTPNAATTLSSAQLVFLGSNPEGIANLPYNQVPVIEQISSNSFFYDPLYAYKPIASYLVGWDFPLNPAQLGVVPGPLSTGANHGAYVMDQTIVYQTANNGFTVLRAANGGLELTANAVGQVAVIQYLGQTEARKILSDRASVNLSLFASDGFAATGNVTLWATTDGALPTLPNTFVTSLDVNGIPLTFSSGNWVQVPNIYQNTSFTVPAASATNAESNDIMLNGWDMAGAVPTNTATFFAIVVGFSAWASPNILTINSVGLCPGDIATRPAHKTQGETLFDCQRYYYKTFNPATVPNVAAPAGIHTGEFSYITTLAGAGNTIYCPSLFFPTPMRAVPNIAYYNPVTATANIRDESLPGDCSATIAQQVTVKDLIFACNGNAGSSVGNVFGVHITADARYGVV